MDSANNFISSYFKDGSKEMTKKLEEKKLYRKAVCTYLGNSDKIDDIEDDQYDVAIICGGFAKGHLPVLAIKQTVRALKSGIY